MFCDALIDLSATYASPLCFVPLGETVLVYFFFRLRFLDMPMSVNANRARLPTLPLLPFFFCAYALVLMPARFAAAEKEPLFLLVALAIQPFAIGFRLLLC